MRSSWTLASIVSLRVRSVAFLLMGLWFVDSPSSAYAQSSNHIGQIAVRVRERHTEGPLAQVCVQLVRFPDGIVSEQFTGSDGGVQFSSISVGAYTIRATRQGYQPGEARVDFRRGDGTLQSVDIPLTPLEQRGTGTPGGTVSTDDLKVPERARKEFERGKRLLNEKKNQQESIMAFQRAIELYPDYSDAYFLLGTAQMQLNDAPAAETSLRKAIALDASRTGPYYSLSMLLFGQRRFKDEEELLLSAQKQDAADWRWPFELARCHAQQSRWDSALQFGLAATGIANAPSKVHLLLADIYANSDKPREAVAELELFAQLDPQSTYMTRVREVLPALRQRAAAATPQPR